MLVSGESAIGVEGKEARAHFPESQILISLSLILHAVIDLVHTDTKPPWLTGPFHRSATHSMTWQPALRLAAQQSF